MTFVGQTATFNAVTRDSLGRTLTGRAVAWSVSNPSLASISVSGTTATVMALAAGSVTVTATSESRSVTAKYVVRLVPVSTVALSATTVHLIAGRVQSLTVTARDSVGGILAGRSAVWSSDDESIATVSQTGLVTAVAPGTATISATLEGKNATGTVVVSQATATGSWGMPTIPMGAYHNTGLDLSFIPFGTQGDFNADGLGDVVVAGWTLYADASRWHTGIINPTAPLKIYVQLADGTFEDATARLLGSELMVYGQEPLVGDVNKDGVDDIVLPPFSDLPPVPALGIALISNGSAGFTRKTLPEAWVHGAALADVTGDGCLDVVNPEYRSGLLRGDCAGNFTSRSMNGIAMGMHACAADLNADGDVELVVPDAYPGGTVPAMLNDNVVFDVNWNALSQVAVAHRLPVPVWDRGRTGEQASHDQRCRVGDLNGDSRPDIIVSATRWAADGVSWEQSSKLQVYLNSGNLAFADVSDQAFPGRSDLTQSSLTLKLTDLNGDGRLDLLYPAEGNGRNANQAWIGNGDGTFREAVGTDWAALHTAAKASVAARGLMTDDTNWGVIPVRRADGRYDFAVPVTAFDNTAQRRYIFLEFSRVGWVF